MKDCKIKISYNYKFKNQKCTRTTRITNSLSEDRTKQMALIQEGVNTEAENFGIKIVDVRIKRADLPQANSDAIFRRMQTERERGKGI